MRREQLGYILEQAIWDISDSEEDKENRLNNIRDEVMYELNLKPEDVSKQLANYKGVSNGSK